MICSRVCGSDGISGDGAVTGALNSSCSIDLLLLLTAFPAKAGIYPSDARDADKWAPAFARDAKSIVAVSQTEDLDRDDGDGLVAQYSLVGLDLAGDIGVLDHRRQAEI